MSSHAAPAAGGVAVGVWSWTPRSGWLRSLLGAMVNPRGLTARVVGTGLASVGRRHQPEVFEESIAAAGCWRGHGGAAGESERLDRARDGDQDRPAADRRGPAVRELHPGPSRRAPARRTRGPSAAVAAAVADPTNRLGSASAGAPSPNTGQSGGVFWTKIGSMSSISNRKNSPLCQRSVP